MVIKTASINNLEEIASVERECFPPSEAATKQQIKERLKAYADHFWLLYDNDKLVGFVDGMVTSIRNLSDEMYENASMHDEYGDWQMIFGVNTIPSYRKQGCAAQLIKRCIEDARQHNRKGVVLTCKEELIHYYAKFGFINEGVSQSVHGNVVWYQMRLTF